MLDRLQRLIEAWLPWYDRALEERRDAHTEAIRKRSIAARVEAEKVIERDRIRRGYRAYGDRMHR